MCHLGVARDLMAALNKDGGNLKLCKPIVDDFKVVNTCSNIEISIKEKTLCPRYSGITISNINVDESPKWLKNRLESNWYNTNK